MQVFILSKEEAQLNVQEPLETRLCLSTRDSILTSVFPFLSFFPKTFLTFLVLVQLSCSNYRFRFSIVFQQFPTFEVCESMLTVTDCKNSREVFLMKRKMTVSYLTKDLKNKPCTFSDYVTFTFTTHIISTARP